MIRDEINDAKDDIVEAMTASSIVYICRILDMGVDKTILLADRTNYNAMKKLRDEIKRIDNEATEDGHNLLKDGLREVIDTPEFFTWGADDIDEELIDIEVELYQLHLPTMGFMN